MGDFTEAVDVYHPLTFLVFQVLCHAWFIRPLAWNMHDSNALFHVIEHSLLHHLSSPIDNPSLSAEVTSKRKQTT